MKLPRVPCFELSGLGGNRKEVRGRAQPAATAGNLGKNCDAAAGPLGARGQHATVRATALGLALLIGLAGTMPAWSQQSFREMATGAQAGNAAPATPGPGFGAPAPQAGANPAQVLLQAELQDYGVPPQAQLHDQLHGPTPRSIPGGQVITTDRLLALYQQGRQNGLLVFDVLGSGQMLPMAQNAVGAAQPGSFDDPVQQEFGRYLQGVTQGDRGRPMVFYCQGPQCWMSYNAALRAIRLGYTQVYWYRGGVEAWQQMQQLAAGMQSAPQPGAGTLPAAGAAMRR